MNDDDKEQLENKKLIAEIKKLESEVTIARGAQIRGWITAVSITVGIIVTAFQVYQTLFEIAYKNRQLAMESQIRSHQLFLNQVLDRLSGFKSINSTFDGEDKLKSTIEDKYGDVTIVGSYGSATALACEFPNLRFPAQVALSFQLAAQPKDHYAETMLKRINEKCPTGWNSITDDEQKSWAKAFILNRQKQLD